MLNDELKKEILELLNQYDTKDSIEIGNSKTGLIKVYVNFEDVESANRKISNAINLLLEHRTKILGGD